MLEHWGINHYLPTHFQLPHTLDIFNIFNLSFFWPTWTQQMVVGKNASADSMHISVWVFFVCFLIAAEDRPACVLGLLVYLAGNQARDESLGCSKLDKMAVLPRLSLVSLFLTPSHLCWTLMDYWPGQRCLWEWGIWSKTTTLVQSRGAVRLFSHSNEHREQS